MTLVVETGTGVTGANTYASLADVRAYGVARGVALSAVDADLEAHITRSMDYLDGADLGLLGLSWPLDDDVLCGSSITTAQALERLKRAQGALCIEQANGVDLAPTRTDAFVTEETIGPITTKYDGQYGGGAGAEPDMVVVEQLIAPLSVACGHGGLFTTARA